MNLQEIFEHNYQALASILDPKSNLEQLNRYRGFGAFKTIHFYSPNCSKEEFQSRCTSKNQYSHFSFYDKLYKLFETFEQQEIQKAELLLESIQSNLFTQFYTPQPLIDCFFQGHKNSRLPINSFLDPAAGSGNFIDGCLKFYPNASIYAFEIDIISSLLLQKKYQNHTHIHIINAPFQDIDKHLPNLNFDLIATNVPFENSSVFDPSIDFKYSTTLHSYFLAKSLQKLNEDGDGFFITPTGIFNSKLQQKLRQHLADNSSIFHAALLPNGYFETTEISSCMLGFTKQKNPNTLNDTFIAPLIDIPIKEKDEITHFPINALFLNSNNLYTDRVLADSVSPSYRPYGRLNLWFEYQASLPIQTEIQRLLANDIFQYLAPSIPLDTEEINNPNLLQLPLISLKPIENISSTGQLGLFDEFPISNQALRFLHLSNNTSVLDKETKLVLEIKSHNQTIAALLSAPSRQNPKQYFYQFYPLISLPSFQSLTLPWQKTDWNSMERLLKNFYEQLHKATLSHYSIQPQFKIYYPTPKLNQLLENLQNQFLNTESQQHIPTEKEVFYQALDPQSKALFNELTAFNTFFQTYKNDIYQRKNEFVHERFNNNYDKLTDKYGYLHHKIYKPYYKYIPQIEELLGLEQPFGQTYIKSDIFQFKKESNLLENNTIDDAISNSINLFNGFNLDYILENSHFSKQEVLEHTQDYVFFDIDTETYRFGSDILQEQNNYRFYYEKINSKLKALETKSNFEFVEGQKLLKYIEKHIPVSIPLSDISINLGVRWLDLKIYEAYFNHLFSNTIQVDYIRNSDEFVLTLKDTPSAILTKEYRVYSTLTKKELNGLQLAHYAIQSTYPLFRHTPTENGKPLKDEKGRTIIKIDQAAEVQAKNLIQSIQNQFKIFLLELPIAEQKMIEEQYNYLFNHSNPPKTEHIYQQIKFKDFHFENFSFDEIQESQKKAIYFNLKNQGGVNDHEVGFGKTVIMCASSHEMNRLNISRKNLILCMKANVNEVAETYKKAYPKDRLLYPGTKDFTKNIQDFLYQVKNNDWHTIVLSYEQFNRIPVNEDIQLDILNRELEAVKESILFARNVKDTRFLSTKQNQGLLIRQKNLEAKIALSLNRREKKKLDKSLSFEDLGIGHIFVDEAHNYKNLQYYTYHQRVKGLSPMQGSDRAFQLLCAIRTIQEQNGRDFGATFLSGTPLSNSLVELYSIFKYLNPSELERKKMEHFDAWAASFCSKTVEYEKTVSLGFSAVERFRTFNNVPELADWYHKITDFCDASIFPIDRPNLTKHLIVIEPNEIQEKYNNYLKEFVENGSIEALGIEVKNENSLMVEAVNHGKNFALDPRLVSTLVVEDNPNSKAANCIQKAIELYNESNPYKGTQMIFSDIGVPDNARFNLYQDIKSKLIQKGIPEQEIEFIHNAPTDEKKTNLYAKMNRGDIRFLIGSSSKAGTGLNVQERLIATHHLDLPWTPRHLIQRDGRMQRRGNIGCKIFRNNECHSFIYALKGSMDEFIFNALANKERFLHAIRSNSVFDRNLVETSYDKNNGASQQEMLAELTGNSIYIELSQLECQVQELKILSHQHEKKCRESNVFIQHYEKQIPLLETKLNELLPLLPTIQSNVLFLEQTKHPQFILNGFEPKEKPNLSDFGQFIKEKYFTQEAISTLSNDPKTIGTIYNYDILIARNYIAVKLDNYRHELCENSLYNAIDWSSMKLAQNIRDAVTKINTFYTETDTKLKNYKQHLIAHKNIISHPFNFKDDLFTKQHRLEQIRAEIKALETAKTNTAKPSKNIKLR